MADETTTENANATPTQEAYDALKLELEGEKQRAQLLVSEATSELTERIATLEADLATRTGEVEPLKVQLKTNAEELEQARTAYTGAVADYKKLVLQTSSLFTADIIWGDTIEDVKASVEKANALVAKVKLGLEEQANALSHLTAVPAGAPARTGPNTEGLSTKEKLTLGLEQAKKRKES